MLQRFHPPVARGKRRTHFFYFHGNGSLPVRLPVENTVPPAARRWPALDGLCPVGNAATRPRRNRPAGPAVRKFLWRQGVHRWFFNRFSFRRASSPLPLSLPSALLSGSQRTHPSATQAQRFHEPRKSGRARRSRSFCVQCRIVEGARGQGRCPGIPRARMPDLTVQAQTKGRLGLSVLPSVVCAKASRRGLPTALILGRALVRPHRSRLRSSPARMSFCCLLRYSRRTKRNPITPGRGSARKNPKIFSAQKKNPPCRERDAQGGRSAGKEGKPARSIGGTEWPWPVVPAALALDPRGLDLAA